MPDFARFMRHGAIRVLHATIAIPTIRGPLPNARLSVFERSVLPPV